MKKYLTLKNLGFAITLVASLLLAKQGFAKIIQTEEMVNNFSYMKLLPYMRSVGLAEVIGVGLLLYPRTSTYGAILLSCIMSAAVALHLSLMGGAKVMVPLEIIFAIWAGHCFRKYMKK